MKSYKEWLAANEAKLQEDYEFDIHEAMRLKNTADYGNEAWKTIEPFEQYYKGQYLMEKEDKEYENETLRTNSQ